MISLLKENQDAKIRITGYADRGTGTDDRNNVLAAERAQAVDNDLRKAGIADSRIYSSSSSVDMDPTASPEANRVAVCIIK